MSISWRPGWLYKVFGGKHLFNDSPSCGISDLEFVATEDRYLKRILKKARSPNLRWLRWYKCPYSSLPSWIPMEKLRVLEVAGDKLETLWQEESEPPLQLRELHIWADYSFSKFPKSIGQLKYLEKITISADGNMLKSLPEEFCELPCLKYLGLENCKQITSLPDSFGRLTRLQHINLVHALSLRTLPESFGRLTRLQHIKLDGAYSLRTLPESFGRLTRLQHIKLDGAYSLRTLPESFGNLSQLKSLELKGCHNLAFSGTTLGNITTLEYLDISFCNVTEWPTQLEHQLSLKELHVGGGWVWLEELPSGIGNLCNLERLHILYCEIKHLPQELLKMNNLLVLEVRNCPLLELPFPFKRIEEERELNKLESFHDDDKCLFALKEISLYYTKISEIFFSGYVCPNLQSLSLECSMKLTQIGGLCGLSKLQHLNLSGCGRLEELPNLEMLISLEILNVTRCKKLRSIPGLGQLKKLMILNVDECHELVELTGAKHLMLLDKISACDCPKLRWGEGELEQLRQRG